MNTNQFVNAVLTGVRMTSEHCDLVSSSESHQILSEAKITHQTGGGIRVGWNKKTNTLGLIAVSIKLGIEITDKISGLSVAKYASSTEGQFRVLSSEGISPGRELSDMVSAGLLQQINWIAISRARSTLAAMGLGPVGLKSDGEFEKQSPSLPAPRAKRVRRQIAESQSPRKVAKKVRGI